MRIVREDNGFYKKVQESYASSNKKNIAYYTPQMFYTPQELKEFGITDDNSIIRLYFYSIGFDYASISNDTVETSGMAVNELRYEKIQLRNCQYEYVYVMFELKNKFLEMYLNVKEDEMYV